MKHKFSNKVTQYLHYLFLVLSLLCILLACFAKVAYANGEESFYEKCVEANSSQELNKHQFFNSNSKNNANEFSYEQYILNNVNNKYSNSEKFESKNVIILKQTLADKSLIPADACLYDLHYGDYYDAEIAMYDEYCVLYNLDDSSMYYVGFANVSDGEVKDYIFARNNYLGEVLDDCIYDWKTGLIYVPKDYMQGKGSENKESVLEVQLQLLISVDVNSENQVADSLNLSINKDGKIIDSTNIKLNALDTSIVIPVGDIDPTKTRIIANNNIEITNKCYFDDGKIYVSESPSNVSCVKVEIDAATNEDKNSVETKNQLSTSIDDIPCLPFSLNKNLPATSGGNFDYVGAKYVARMPLYYTETPSAAPYQECLYGVNGFTTDDSIRTFADRIWNDTGEVDLSNLLMVENRSLNLFTLYPVDVFRETGIVLALKCGHIGTPASHDPDLKEIRTKILAINSAAGYALVGFVTQVAGYTNQGGCGIYKVKYDFKAGCQMTKRSSLDWSYSNPNYSLSGVRYNIYYDAACSSYTGVSIYINADGSGHTSENALIAYREYYVKEDLNNTGNNYLYNSSIGYVYLSNVNSYSNTITWSGLSFTSDKPLFDTQPIGLWKADSQIKEPGTTSGSVASFEGAWYEYQFYTDYFTNKSEIEIHQSSYKKHWVLQTDINGMVCLSEDYRNNKISGDDFYEDENNQVVSPLGTYVIHEVKAPVGYLVSEKYYIMQISSSKEGGLHAVCLCFDGDSGQAISSIHDSQTGNDFVVAYENIIRGDYSFIKTNAESEHLSGIPFKITSVSTGEWHIVVTDSNGSIDTSSSHLLHSTNTNYNDALYDLSTGKIINEEALRSDCGCWFALNKKTHEVAEADDDVGALPYDSYIIEEILISKNEMYYPFAKRSFIVNNNSYIINGGTWINSKVTCVTEANGADGTKQIDASSNELVCDRIYYSNLNNGNIYEVNAWLIERSSGQLVPLENSGSVSYYVTKSFIANDSIGYVDVDSHIDARPYIGKNLVWFVELFDAGYSRQIIEHKDLYDEQETLIVNKPSFETDLYEHKTLEKTIDKKTEAILVDQISYQNLKVGTKYTFIGNLFDKQKGEVCQNIETGEMISASCEFIAKSEFGNASIYYTLDSSVFSDGSELVSCVELYDGNLCVCENKSLDDQRETVVIGQPQIKTLATTLDGSKTFVKGPNTKIKDTISYENFTENEELSIYSWFCYADTGIPVTDGSVDDNKAIEEISKLLEIFGGELSMKNNSAQGSQDFPEQWIVQFYNVPNKFDDSLLSDYDWNKLSHFMFSKKIFSPEEKEGKEEIHYLFDSTNCRVGKIVAYTIITMGDTLLLADTNINNEDETMQIEAKVEPVPVPGFLAKTYDTLLPLIAVLVLVVFIFFALNKKLSFSSMSLPAYISLKLSRNYNCINKETLNNFNMYFSDL